MQSWIDAGNYAEAQKIYVIGKNAFRSLTAVPPVSAGFKPLAVSDGRVRRKHLKLSKAAVLSGCVNAAAWLRRCSNFDLLCR